MQVSCTHLVDLLTTLLSHVFLSLSLFVPLSSHYSPIQARANSLTQQLAEVHDQAEQGHVELQTFKRLHEMEGVAIPHRLEVSIVI